MEMPKKYLWNNDYFEKVELFYSKIDEIKEGYKGIFDKSKSVFTVLIDKNTGNMRLVINSDVPRDIKAQVKEAFDTFMNS